MNFFHNGRYLYIKITLKQKMANEKSLVEEAIIQMKNLEEAVAENAKGILASTMSQEIKDLVKESLSEQEEDEVETDVDVEDMDDSDDTMDMDMDDESEDDMDDTEMDNIDMDFGDEMDDEDDVIDLTDADDEEVLRVFQLMGPEDNIIVTKDESGNTHLKDEETGKEYMIVGEGEEEMDESWNEMDEEEDMEIEKEDMEIEEEDIDEETIESIVERMFGSDDEMEFDDEEDIEFDDEEMFESDEDMDEEMFESDEDMDEEIVYEIEMEDEEEDESEIEESLYESKSKAKRISTGKASNFKYDKAPNLNKGFDTKMKEGDKTMGTGKPRFTYKDGENAGSKFGKNKIVKKSETKEGTLMKKSETKEASRTLGNGSAFRKGGLPKPRAHSKFNANIKENTSNTELKVLREKNEEYRKALNIFRNKLNEVAVFNSNLAYATRLFTEHSTSKQEKINILRRFDSVETIKESKNLYQTIKNELSDSGTKTQTVNESLERKIAKAPSTGSAVNLIESKTYENPQFLRMKDLMAKIK
jgi:hypothetical protein